MVSRSYVKAAWFPSFSLFILSYKDGAVNFHSWNHFPCLEKASFSPPSYMSSSSGNVQHALSPDFLVVWASLKSYIFTLHSVFFLSLSSFFPFFKLFFHTHWIFGWKLLFYNTVEENFSWKKCLKTLGQSYEYVCLCVRFISTQNCLTNKL